MEEESTKAEQTITVNIPRSAYGIAQDAVYEAKKKDRSETLGRWIAEAIRQRMKKEKAEKEKPEEK